MEKPQTLNRVWSDWSLNGVFSALSSIEGFTPPWSQEAVVPLNMQYHGNHSGRKLTSPLLDSLLDGSKTLTSDQKKQLATVCASIYGENWAKLWATLKFEYNPIENYDMTEEGKDTSSVQDSETTTTSTTYGKQEAHDFRDETTDSGTVDTSRSTNTDGTRTTSGEVKRSHGEVITTQRDGTQDKEHGIYGFNTADPASPASHDTDTETLTVTDTHSGTDTDTSTGSETTHQDGTETGKETRSLSLDKDTTGTIKHTGTDTQDSTATQERSASTDHSLTRHGNIGVTTSQQMITQERELWLWQFFSQVFADLDKVLTSPIY